MTTYEVLKAMARGTCVENLVDETLMIGVMARIGIRLNLQYLQPEPTPYIKIENGIARCIISDIPEPLPMSLGKANTEPAGTRKGTKRGPMRISVEEAGEILDKVPKHLRVRDISHEPLPQDIPDDYFDRYYGDN